MKRTQRKDAWRNIWKQKVSYLSIAVIAFLGVAAFLGINYASAAMKKNGSDLYNGLGFRDVEVMSTRLLTPDDLEALRGVEGVADVEPLWQVSANAGVGDAKTNVAVISLTERLNQPILAEGRLPQAADECAVERRLAERMGWRTGDVIDWMEVTGGADAYFRGTGPFRITGLVEHPDHININVPDTLYMLVIRDLFDEEALDSCCMKALIAVEGNDPDRFEPAYDDAVGQVLDRVEAMASARTALRDEQVQGVVREKMGEIDAELASAKEQLDDARRELDEGWWQLDEGEAALAEGQQELIDAKGQLEDSQKELDAGEEELQAAKAELDAGEQELKDAKEQLDAGEAELKEARAELDAGEEELKDAKAELDAGEAELQEAKAELDAGEEELKDAKEQLDAGEAELQAAKAELDAGEQELKEAKAQLDAGEQELWINRDKLAAGKQALREAKAELDAGAKVLNESKAELDAGAQQLQEARVQLDDAKAQLEEAKAALDSGSEELFLAKLTLEDGWEQLEGAKGMVRDTMRSAVDQVTGLDSSAYVDWSGTRQGNVDVSMTTASELWITEGIKVDLSSDWAQAAARFASGADIPESVLREAYAAMYANDPNPPAYDPEAMRTMLMDRLASAAAGYAQLVNAANQWDSGHKKYLTGVVIYNRNKEKYEQALAAYEDSERAYAEGLAQYEAGLAQYNEGVAAYREGVARYNQGVAEYNAGRDLYAQGLAQYADGLAKYNEGLAQYNEGRDRYAEGLAAWEAGQAEYREGVIRYEDGLAQYNDGLAAWEAGKAQYDEGLAEYEQGLAQYTEGLAEYQRGRAEYEDGVAKYEDGLAQYNEAAAKLEEGKAAYAEGLAKYEQGVKDLEAGREEIEANRKKLEDGEREYAQGLAEYADGLVLRDEALAKLNETLGTEPSRWIVLDTRGNASFVQLDEASNNLHSLQMTFSLLFIVIGALVIYATVSKMVDEQRTLVGATKALGFYNGEIFVKYLLFGLSATAIGAVGGLLIARFALERFVLQSYNIHYTVDITRPLTLWLPTLTVVLGGVVLAAAAVTFAIERLVRTPAIQLMQPPTPRSRRKADRGGKHLLSLYSRLVLLNIRTDIKRVLVTVVSVAGCCALVVIGFTIKYAIDRCMEQQYGDISVYDGRIRFDEGDALAEKLQDAGAEFVPLYDGNVTFRITDMDMAELFCGDIADIGRMYRLLDWQTGEPLAPTDEGVLIQRRMAEIYGIDAGGEFTLTMDGTKSATVRVAGVFENYIGQPMVMSRACYAAAFGEEIEDNAFFVRFGGGDRAALLAELAETDGYVDYAASDEGKVLFESATSVLNGVVALFILMAAVMAGVVLMNLTNLYILQKKQELTVMRINGFTTREVIAYVTRETVLTTILGILLGLVVGSLVGRRIVEALEQSIFHLERSVCWSGWLYAAVMTVLFTVAVNSVALRKVKHLKLTDVT